MRNTMGRLIAATTVAGGLLVAGSPAITAEAAPSASAHLQRKAQVVASGVKARPDGVGDSGQICLKNAPSYCIHANGAGKQVTITNVAADKANFYVIADSDGLFEWQDGNGNCLREGTGGVVKIENGHCSSFDLTDSWYKTNNLITNASDSTTMYTKGDANGDNVWTAVNPGSGSWQQWTVPT